MPETGYLNCSVDRYTRATGDSRSVVEISTSNDSGTKMDEQAACVNHQHAEQRASNAAAVTSSSCCC